jgi:hypothetical protein
MKYLIGFILLLFLLPHCSKNTGGYGTVTYGVPGSTTTTDLDPSTALDADPRHAMACRQSGGKVIGMVGTSYKPELGKTTAVVYFDHCQY